VHATVAGGSLAGAALYFYFYSLLFPLILDCETAMTERLPAFQITDATPEQKAVLDEILSGPRGNLNGPFLGWIHSPELAQQAQRLGAFCRYRTGLPLQAEWYIHYPIALEAGVREADAEAIRAGRRPVFADPDDALVYDFASELYDTRRVSDATYEKALGRFGHQVVINLVGLLGYYALVAMTLNVFDMRAIGQKSLPFAE